MGYQGKKEIQDSRESRVCPDSQASLDRQAGKGPQGETEREERRGILVVQWDHKDPRALRESPASPEANTRVMVCLQSEDLGAPRESEEFQECRESTEKRASLERASWAHRASWDHRESQELRASAELPVYLALTVRREERVPLVDRGPQALLDLQVNRLPCPLLEMRELCPRMPAACARPESQACQDRRERRGPPEHKG